MAKRFYSEGSYASREEVKRTERRDGEMISEDHSQVANLPQEVIMRPWSSNERYLPEDIDDTIVGVDRQINGDNRKRDESLNPKKV